eukprot:274405_1
MIHQLVEQRRRCGTDLMFVKISKRRSKMYRSHRKEMHRHLAGISKQISKQFGDMPILDINTAKHTILFNFPEGKFVYEIIYDKQSHASNGILLLANMTENTLEIDMECLRNSNMHRLESGHIITLMGFKKHSFEMELRMKHVRAPWVKKRCEKCYAATSKK